MVVNAWFRKKVNRVLPFNEEVAFTLEGHTLALETNMALSAVGAIRFLSYACEQRICYCCDRRTVLSFALDIPLNVHWQACIIPQGKVSKCMQNDARITTCARSSKGFSMPQVYPPCMC